MTVDFVALVILAVCLVLALGIFFVTVIFLIRYHESRPADRRAPPRTNTFLELVWIAVPTLLGLVLFALGAQVYYEQYTVRSDASLELEVVGMQWMWRIRYPNGYRTLNDFVLPRGRVVKLRMISQDVIHSFSLPALRIKRDVLPGRYTELTIVPQTDSHLFCAEYCGTDHAVMGGELHVLEPEEFDAWLAARSPLGQTPVERGRRLFASQGCASCHSGPGPRLAQAYGRVVALTDGRVLTVDEAYLRRSILDPASEIVAGFQPIMPTYQDRLSEDQLLDLIAYIRAGAPP